MKVCIDKHLYVMSCSDLNECSDPGPCGVNFLCENTPGSYVCRCKAGYKLNADTGTCDEVNECENDNNCDQVCVDGVGKYTCDCDPGFNLLQSDLTSCIREYYIYPHFDSC